MATITAVDAVQPGIQTGSASHVERRHMPLSRIVVPGGFNPRGQAEDDWELEQMAGRSAAKAACSRFACGRPSTATTC